MNINKQNIKFHIKKVYCVNTLYNISQNVQLYKLITLFEPNHEIRYYIEFKEMPSKKEI